MAEPKMKRKPKAVSRTEELLLLVKGLTRRVDDPTHPLNAPNAQIQAANVLRTEELLQLLRNPPSEEDPMHKIYTTAVKTLEEETGIGGVEGIVVYIQRSLVAGMRGLNYKTDSMADLGMHETAIRGMLKRIKDGLKDRDPDYMPYLPVWNDINALWDLSRGGKKEAVIAPTDVVVSEAPAPLIELEIGDMGPIHLLRSKAEETVLVLNASTTPMLDRLAGGKAVSQALVDYITGGYAALYNHADDPDFLGKASKDLDGALDQIPEGSLMRDNEGYKAARDALQGCRSAECLKTALQALSGETAFNTLFSELDNMYIVSVTQRGVAVARSGVSVRYVFDKNVKAHEEFMEGVRTGSFSPRFLSLALGLYYEYLSLSGQLQQLRFERGPGGEMIITKTGKEKLTGAGHALTVRPSATIGTSAWGRPIEIVLHAAAGYRDWEVGKDVPMVDGSIQRLSVGSKEGVLGLLGAEVRWPGEYGLGVKLERIGVALAAAESVELTNPLGYVTFSGTWYKDRNVRLQSFFDLTLGYVLGQVVTAPTLEPLKITWQIDKDWTLGGGVGVRYDFFYRPGYKEKETGMRVPEAYSHTYDVFGELGVRYARGVNIDLALGYIGKKGEEVVPEVPYGSLLVTLTPGLWFKRKEKAVARGVVPSKTLVAGVRKALAKSYRDNLVFLKAASKEEFKKAGPKRAKDLAARLEGAALMIGPRTRASKSYKEAVKHLRAGRLEEGMAALGKLVTFKRIKEGRG